MKKLKCNVCGEEKPEAVMVTECSDCYVKGWKKQWKEDKKNDSLSTKGVTHVNSCGKGIFDKDNNLAICCGDDLGGDNNEFAQCKECREKDYLEHNKVNPYCNCGHKRFAHEGLSDRGKCKIDGCKCKKFLEQDISAPKEKKQ